MKMMKIMKICPAVLLSFSFVPRCIAQVKPSHPPTSTDPDRLGQTCAQILQMSSAGWVANFEQKTAPAAADKPATTLRAIAAYENCYEERTNRLAATLGKGGKGPLMGATGNFRAFQKALDDFTAKTLAATHKDPATTPAAYAALYEKLFRYQFYQSYTQKDFLSRPLTPDESDELAKAKNRFGEVLGLLPDESLHSVHTAFRQIFDPAPVTNLTKLELYRYAIFLLAPVKDKPFSPPPF